VRYVALLRGVNVGGSNKISMADLRALLSSLGHEDVITYLQSGNAIFTSARQDPEALAAEIEDGIARELGLRITVLVRTPEELAAVIAGNPFPGVEANPTQLHVAFLTGPVEAERLAEIDARRFEPDELRPGDRALYLHYPNGAGRTKLTLDVCERRLGVSGTARNWNTVTKLFELARQ